MGHLYGQRSKVRQQHSAHMQTVHTDSAGQRERPLRAETPPFRWAEDRKATDHNSRNSEHDPSNLYAMKVHTTDTVMPGGCGAEGAGDARVDTRETADLLARFPLVARAPHIKQSFDWDCGLACTAMALAALRRLSRQQSPLQVAVPAGGARTAEDQVVPVSLDTDEAETSERNKGLHCKSRNNHNNNNAEIITPTSPTMGGAAAGEVCDAGSTVGRVQLAVAGTGAKRLADTEHLAEEAGAGLPSPVEEDISLEIAFNGSHPKSVVRRETHTDSYQLYPEVCRPRTVPFVKRIPSVDRLAAIVATQDVWTIDLAYLLRKFKVNNFTYYTSYFGINSKYTAGTGSFYGESVKDERPRIHILFCSAAESGIKILPYKLELNELKSKLKSNSHMAIMLVDLSHLKCSHCTAVALQKQSQISSNSIENLNPRSILRNSTGSASSRGYPNDKGKLRKFKEKIRSVLFSAGHNSNHSSTSSLNNEASENYDGDIENTSACALYDNDVSSSSQSLGRASHVQPVDSVDPIEKLDEGTIVPAVEGDAADDSTAADSDLNAVVPLNAELKTTKDGTNSDEKLIKIFNPDGTVVSDDITVFTLSTGRIPLNLETSDRTTSKSFNSEILKSNTEVIENDDVEVESKLKPFEASDSVGSLESDSSSFQLRTPRLSETFSDDINVTESEQNSDTPSESQVMPVHKSLAEQIISLDLTIKMASKIASQNRINTASEEQFPRNGAGHATHMLVKSDEHIVSKHYEGGRTESDSDSNHNYYLELPSATTASSIMATPRRGSVSSSIFQSLGYHSYNSSSQNLSVIESSMERKTGYTGVFGLPFGLGFGSNLEYTGIVTLKGSSSHLAISSQTGDQVSEVASHFSTPRSSFSWSASESGSQSPVPSNYPSSGTYSNQPNISKHARSTSFGSGIYSKTPTSGTLDNSNAGSFQAVYALAQAYTSSYTGVTVGGTSTTNRILINGGSTGHRSSRSGSSLNDFNIGTSGSIVPQSTNLIVSSRRKSLHNRTVSRDLHSFLNVVNQQQLVQQDERALKNKPMKETEVNDHTVSGIKIQVDDVTIVDSESLILAQSKPAKPEKLKIKSKPKFRSRKSLSTSDSSKDIRTVEGSNDKVTSKPPTKKSSSKTELKQERQLKKTEATTTISSSKKKKEVPPLPKETTIKDSNDPSNEYVGHYILVIGYNVDTDEFIYRDPGTHASACTVPASVLETARNSYGTDSDCILIGCHQ